MSRLSLTCRTPWGSGSREGAHGRQPHLAPASERWTTRSSSLAQPILLKLSVLTGTTPALPDLPTEDMESSFLPPLHHRGDSSCCWGSCSLGPGVGQGWMGPARGAVQEEWGELPGSVQHSFHCGFLSALLSFHCGFIPSLTQTSRAGAQLAPDTPVQASPATPPGLWDPLHTNRAHRALPLDLISIWKCHKRRENKLSDAGK